MPSEQMLELKALYDKYVIDPRFEGLRIPGVIFVPGSGLLNPTLMLVGEAPGRLENAKTKPFVGRSGIILRNLLMDRGINPDEVFMTNVVKYWPQDPNNKGKTRSPEPEEVEASREYLQKEIEIVNPAIVGLCGRFAIRTIYPNLSGVKVHHGELLDDMYVPLYHPAVISYTPWKRKLVESGYESLKHYVLEAEVA